MIGQIITMHVLFTSYNNDENALGFKIEELVYGPKNVYVLKHTMSEMASTMAIRGKITDLVKANENCWSKEWHSLLLLKMRKICYSSNRSFAN
jgi:hypothetical protein